MTAKKSEKATAKTRTRRRDTSFKPSVNAETVIVENKNETEPTDDTEILEVEKTNEEVAETITEAIGGTDDGIPTETTSEEYKEEYNKIVDDVNEALKNVDNETDIEAIVGEKIEKLEEMSDNIEKRIEELEKAPILKRRNNVTPYWNGMTASW